MKKLFVFCFLLSFVIPLTISSQTYLGFSAGLLTVPYLDYSNNHKYQTATIDYKPSFTVSGIFRDQFSRHFSIGFNLNYSYYMADYTYSWWSPMGDGGNKEAYCRFGHLGIYFYPQLSFGKKLSFYFNAGFYFGWLINFDIQSESDNKVDGSDLEDSKSPAFMSAIGLLYAVDDSWQITFDASFRKSHELFNNNTVEGQWDVLFSLGFCYKIINKSLLGNKKTTPEN